MSGAHGVRLCSTMTLTRSLTALIVTLVVLLGPALFMASSPCFECDGICGAAATFASADLRSVLLVLPVPPAPRAAVPPPPVQLVDLPPRPLHSTV